MSCDEIKILLEGYDAGSLDGEQAMAIENHFDTCPACRQEWQRFHAMRTALGNRALYRRAPDTLRQSIQKALSEEKQVAPVAKAGFFSWRPFALSGVVAVIAFLFGGIWHPFTAINTPTDGLISEVVSNHVRSLQPNHLMDVISTDQHTVKPWFNGKLDFAPPVVDLKDRGFPLVGGRLDAIKGHPVAALVYRRQRHIINLLVWPSTDSGVAIKSVQKTAATYRGYHILTWQQADMVHCAVSDLNERELGEFAQYLSP